MAFWSSWFGGRGAGIRAKGVQDGAPNNPNAVYPVTWDSALQLSAVWACVRLLSESIASMPIKFYLKDGKGERTAYDNHPLCDLLNYSPNRYQTRQEFFETLMFNLFLHGNCYAHVERRSNKTISSLLPLMSQQMQVATIDGGDRVYNYTENTMMVFAQETVWHVPLMPSNAIIGLSPLNYASKVVGIAEAAENRVGTSARNGFKPTGVLMIDRVLSDAQRNAIRANFSDLQEGSGDALRVLEAGMTYQQISISPKDAQLLETRQFSIEEIARFFNVPSVLINDTKSTTAWGTGIGQIVEGFGKFSLRPITEKLEASMSKWLLTPAEQRTIDIEFDFDALMRGDSLTRANIAQVQINSGTRTINEVRKVDGIGPLAGGDDAYMQAQMTPISTLIKGNGQNAPQSTPNKQPVGA